MCEVVGDKGRELVIPLNDLRGRDWIANAVREALRTDPPEDLNREGC